MLKQDLSNSEGLTLKNFFLSFEDRVLINNLSLKVKAGEILTVMGPSGIGKSSLLLFIMGLLSRDFNAKGTISLNGKILNDIAPERRQIGLLFQEDLLMPHLNVLDNLILGMPAGVPKKQKIIKATLALSECKLAGYEKKSVNKLSGGQKARVSLWRTLLSEPKAILLDEPFSKLDLELKNIVRKYFKDHITAKNIPTIIVTHDDEDAKWAGGQALKLLANKPK